MKLRTSALLLAISFFCAVMTAQQQKEQGTIIDAVQMYVSPDFTSQKLAQATRGRDVPLVMERTMIGDQSWAHVLIVVDVDRDRETDRQITGWVPSKIVISTSTPNGDRIIFGEAVDSENQAELRGGRKHAAEDAMRLYYRIYDYWPNSPLAGEALWRAADVRWQLEKANVSMRPSSREMSPDLRNPLDDENMKLVMKKFPHTKWSDLAAYDLIDNKLCGSWKGETHCPEKESELYEKYAREHTQSPKVAEALFNAAWRQAALIQLYGAGHDKERDKARKKAIELAQEAAAKSPAGDPKLSDWKPRAMELMYALQQGIPTYDAQTDRK
jgi:hypothetical protein